MFTRSTILDFTGKKLALSFIAHELVDGQRPPPPPPTSTGCHSRDRCSQTFPVFCALPLFCNIILNGFRRTKNGGGLGTRLILMYLCQLYQYSGYCNVSTYKALYFLAMKFPITQVLGAVFSLYMYCIVQISLYSTIAIPAIYQFYVSWRTVGTPYVGMSPKKNGGYI